MTDEEERLDAISHTAREDWHGFLELFEPLRPELYRFCRYLTRSPWDAEDLAQDVLTRAFVGLAQRGSTPTEPRAWLFRVASNLWIDRARRETRWSDDPGPEPSSEAPRHRAVREAAGTLLTDLAPQERTAVVLKDVFGLRLEEVAEVLSTTVGAVKSALHRGRGKLAMPELEPSTLPASPVLDAFCEAFNRQDLSTLTDLLLEHAQVEVVGATREGGRDGNVLAGMVFGSERMAAAAELGGIDPRFIAGVHPTPARLERVGYRGQPLLLSWYEHDDGDFVRAVTRLDVEDGAIGRLRNYFFTPDVVADVCRELELPHRSNGYRWWLSRVGCPAPR